MQVPRDDQGRPRFSVTQFRVYGGINGEGGTFEEPRGCPHKYLIKYEQQNLPPREQPPELLFGSLLHRVLHVMERDQTGPDEAMQACWDASLPFPYYDQARRLLADYMTRDSPLSMYATLDFERELVAELYVDDKFGPVMYSAIFDWLGMDTVYTDVMHCSDYKSDQRPPARATVEQNPQLLGQQWLLEQEPSWRALGFRSQPQVVMHLDALRWRDFEVPFEPGDIERWHRWAVAMASTILRDQDGEPRLNQGCTRCEAQSMCPLWQRLPGEARTVAMRQAGDTLAELEQRRAELGLVRKLVGDAYDAVMTKLNELARLEGQIQVGDELWTNDGTEWETIVDWDRLQKVLGPKFWSVVAAPKSAIERATEHDPSQRAAALACLDRVPVGSKIRRKKAKNATNNTGTTGVVGGSTPAAGTTS